MTDTELVRRITEAQAAIRRNKAHRYQVYHNGQWHYTLGVTSILKMLDKPYLVGWAARLAAESGDPKAHEKQRDDASDKGKSLHAAIERECRLMMGEPVGEGLALTEDESMALARWQQWARESEFRPLAVEFYIHHAEYDYAGQPDALGYVRPRRRDGSRGEPILAVLDWKSGGQRLYDTHHLQSVPYRVGLADMVSWEVPPGYLLHVPRNGDTLTEARATDNVDLSMRAFLGLKEAYLWKRAIEREMKEVA